MPSPTASATSLPTGTPKGVPILKAVTNVSASRLRAIARAGALRRRMERETPSSGCKGCPASAGPRLEARRSVRQPAEAGRGPQPGIPDLELMIMSEPTRRSMSRLAKLHQPLSTLRQRRGILIASSDLDELLDLSHRILVVRNHTIEGSFERAPAARPSLAPHRVAAMSALRPRFRVPCRFGLHSPLRGLRALRPPFLHLGISRTSFASPRSSPSCRAVRRSSSFWAASSSRSAPRLRWRPWWR